VRLAEQRFAHDANSGAPAQGRDMLSGKSDSTMFEVVNWIGPSL